MKFPFQPGAGTIPVQARIIGPGGPSRFTLLLDTGANGTTVAPTHLIAAGYDPAHFPPPVPVTTAGGTVYAPQIRVTAFETLGAFRMNYPILVHAMPTPLGVGGVLGLDFFDGYVLTLDFVRGEIDLSPGSPVGAVP
jgi:predicted aspartyl protease